MITLKIIDENKEVEIKELTDTGRQIILNECKELLNHLEEFKENEI